MDSLISYALVQGLLLGMGLSITISTWKKYAAKWDNWFPLLRSLLKMALYACMIGVLFMTMKWANEAEVSTLGIGALIGFVIPWFLSRFQKGVGGGDRHERGTKVGTALQIKAMMLREKKKTFLEFGGVPLPVDAEPYHTLIAGSTGSGKSVAIKRLLDKLRSRGDTVILVDSGGEFLARYWDENVDYVINPFDARCIPWSPTAEMTDMWDAEALSRSIIPSGTGENKEWNGYAQTFLTSCLQKLWERNELSLEKLLWMIQSASIAELKPILEGTPAYSQMQSDKTFGSIRTIAGNYMLPYNYLEKADAYFSVAEFVKAQNGGFLYLTYRDDQLDSLRSLISCVLDIAARTILSLTPDSNRRVWLVIDEFASIGKVQSIEAMATKARKVGGSLVIGIQSIAQLRDRYGDHVAQTILSCLSTWVVLRCTDVDTAEYMSKFIGDEEIRRTVMGSSVSDAAVTTNTKNEQTTTQRVLLASEIQQLANLQGYVNIAGHYPLCKIKLEFPANIPNMEESYVRRDFTAQPPVSKFIPRPNLEEKPKAAAAAPTAPAAATPPPRSLLISARK